MLNGLNPQEPPALIYMDKPVMSASTVPLESLAKQSISKACLVKWLLLTPAALSGVIAVIVTLCITGWYTGMRLEGMPQHHGSIPAHVRNIILPTGTIVGEWFTVWLWCRIFRKTDTFASLFQTRTKRLWMELGIGFAAAAVLVCLATLLHAPAPQWSRPLIVLTALTAGFCEEFLFRGFLINIIRRAGLGWTAQILLSSAAFAVGLGYMGPWGIAWAGFVGLLFGSITVWRGNVWATVTAHALVDLCVMLRLFSWMV